MTYNLVTDIKTLTSMKHPDKITALATDIISYDVQESLINKDTFSEIDIGIGTLYILLEDDQIKYKFEPSTTLEDKLVKATTDNKENPLKKPIASRLTAGFASFSKDLL